jgi:mxaA protein
MTRSRLPAALVAVAGCCASLAVMAMAMAMADTAIRTIDIRMPRPFGYVIGDVIRHEVELVLNTPYRLRAGDSFPETGRLTHWLAFQRPEVVVDEQTGYTVYTITLNYQIVNIHPRVAELTTPQLKLVFSDGQGRLSATVPEWRFRVAMLSAPEQPAAQLRPDQPPPALPAGMRYTSAVAAAGLLMALAGLIYVYGRLPFLRSHNGPFSRACRRLSGLSVASRDQRQYQQALRTVHEAFNQTMNKTVFVDDLDDFFRHHPRFRVLRQPIEQYFRHTREVFFTHSAAAGEAPRYSLQSLLGLCRDCRDVERGWR